MPCYHPIPASQDKPGEPIKLHPALGEANLQVPCGTCLGCKTNRATQWGIRAMHEAAFYEHNCFLTLTLNDEAYGRHPELDKQRLSDFLRALRQKRNRDRDPHISSDPALPLRYLACGEYGDQTRRPHYHLCLFNCAFNDQHRVGKRLFESDLLTQLWPEGQNRIGELTVASASYVAQYTLKKIGVTHCDADGVILAAPFLAVSLKPALGTRWIEKYKRDMTHGYLVNDGHKAAIPRTYRNKLKEIDKPLSEHVDHQVYQARKPASQRDNLTAAEIIHHRSKQLRENRSL